MFPAPPKYMLEFNPGVPLRYTPGYKYATPTALLIPVMHLLCPIFLGSLIPMTDFGKKL
jgi:hypothetical protein